MNKKFKRGISICVAALITSMSSAYAADVKVYDECISVSGTIKAANSGEKVTVSVLPQGESWDGITQTGEIQKRVEYYGETELDGNNGYTTLFALKKAGRYCVYIGAESSQTPDKADFVYMSTSAYKGFVENTDKDSLAAYIKANKESLGIEDSLIQSNEEIKTIADILFDELKLPIETSEVDGDQKSELLESIEKAVALVGVNNGKITDMKSFLALYKLSEKEEKFYNSEFSDEVLKGISNKNIKTFAELDNAVRDSIILTSVNHGSETKIGQVLSGYSKIFTNTNKSGLNAAVAKAAPFKTVDELKNFVSNYKDGSNNGGGSGNSSGSSGGSSGGGLMPGTLNPNPSKDDNTDIKPTYVFDDISELDWAVDAITQLYYKGVINGKSEKLFAPNDTVTREEFAKMISLAFEMKLVDNEFPFEDITSDDWSFPYVKTAYLAGVTNGIEDKVFGKGTNISRQDLCTMVYRAVNSGDYTLPSGNNVVLNDGDEISDYAKDAVLALTGAGIVSGDENANFNPSMPATRAEAAKIIYLTIQNMK